MKKTRDLVPYKVINESIDNQSKNKKKPCFVLFLSLMRIYVWIINIILVIKIIQDYFYSTIDETKIIDCMLDSYMNFIVRFVNMRIDKGKKNLF